MLTSRGSINDQSWNASGYAGLIKLREMGMEVAYSENVQPADHDVIGGKLVRPATPRLVQAAEEKNVFAIGRSFGTRRSPRIACSLTSERSGPRSTWPR